MSALYADSKVTLRGKNGTILTSTSYTVNLGIFDSPSSFSFRLGNGTVIAQVLASFDYGDPFQISIDDHPQFSGRIDGWDAPDNGGGTEITIQGYDVLEALHAFEIESEESFQAKSHKDLVQLALDRTQILKPFSTLPPSILTSNGANRKAVTGASGSVLTTDDYGYQLVEIAGTEGNSYKVSRTQLGESMLDYVKRHLDAAGLFFWCTGDGDVVVGRPNTGTPPLTAIWRRRGRVATSNVIGAHYSFTARPLHSEVVIFGKSSGKKFSRTTVKGAYTDDVLIARGMNRPRVERDVHVTSTQHAERVAKKALAAGHRAALNLSYTIAGHTLPGVYGSARVIPSPDTMIDVDDDEYGLHGHYYIEKVTHASGPQATTTITLLDPDTLIFGDDAFPSQSTKRK